MLVKIVPLALVSLSLSGCTNYTGKCHSQYSRFYEKVVISIETGGNTAKRFGMCSDQFECQEMLDSCTEEAKARRQKQTELESFVRKK